eukprot:TRINITY_DN6311_c0_g1_i6.p1 TRINITY_DN6311_c0_g1~~TRINITY_DN6311_c0_g1_i6.p1  ORF type:complete len:131 (+),score=33.49 TRINITY_DN6311_c0_g1_i6:242-634(+)
MAEAQPSPLPRIAILALLFSVGVLLQILSCALFDNWWPMLTAIMFVILPMPCLFFSEDTSSYYMNGSGGSDWEEASKFLTGFSSVGSIAIPAILHHAGLITTGALGIQLAAFVTLLLTLLLFQRMMLSEA